MGIRFIIAADIMFSIIAIYSIITIIVIDIINGPVFSPGALLPGAADYALITPKPKKIWTFLYLQNHKIVGNYLLFLASLTSSIILIMSL